MWFVLLMCMVEYTQIQVCSTCRSQCCGSGSMREFSKDDYFITTCYVSCFRGKTNPRVALECIEEAWNKWIISIFNHNFLLYPPNFLEYFTTGEMKWNYSTRTDHNVVKFSWRASLYNYLTGRTWVLKDVQVLEIYLVTQIPQCICQFYVPPKYCKTGKFCKFEPDAILWPVSRQSMNFNICLQENFPIFAKISCIQLFPVLQYCHVPERWVLP